MSVPPQILRIKRKAEDSPVDALYIENSSKRRLLQAQNYIFRRLIPTAPEPIVSAEDASQNVGPAYTPSFNIPAAPNGIPQVLATKPGDENTLLSQRKQPSKSRHNDSAETVSFSAPPKHPFPVAAAQPGRQQPRRFHLFIPNPDGASAQTTVDLSPNKRKRKVATREDGATIAVFVEEGVDQQQRKIKTRHSPETSEVSQIHVAGNDYALVNGSPSKARKRPGAAAAMPKSTAPTTSSSQRERIGEGPQPDVREALMKYALGEFERAERDAIPELDDGTDTMDIDGSDANNGEYIFDTYVRHPNPLGPKASSSMDTYALAGDTSPSVGYLVIPDTPSADFFYSLDGDESDTAEGDWDSEQDDENAENYYAADYPEEEQRSDGGRDTWSADEEYDIGSVDDGASHWELKKKEWSWKEYGDGMAGKRTMEDSVREESEDEE